MFLWFGGLMTLTVNEFRHLFDALLLGLLGARRTVPPAAPHHLAPKTLTPTPADATTDVTNTNDHELRLQR